MERADIYERCAKENAGMRLNEKLTKCAAAAVLSIGAAAPALGGSVTRPGDTVGASLGMRSSGGLRGTLCVVLGRQ
jgi:hypothetical protein